MSINRRVILTLSMAGATLMAACESPPPRVYTLAPVPGVSRSGIPHTVLVRQSGIARYLEGPDIVRSSENYWLDVRTNEIWGEPLETMIGRVLTEDLSQRLPGTTFVHSAGAIGATEAAAIGVKIDRMDIDASQSVALDAKVTVTFADRTGSKAPRTFCMSVPVSTGSTTAQVQATSIALGQLADQIADTLRQPPPPRHEL